jgi:hypothetical protein
MDSDLIREIGAVLLVLTLLGLGVWGLRSTGTRRSRPPRSAGALSARASWASTAGVDDPPVLERVERLALTPQHCLHAIRAGACEILVATHPQGCTLLSQVVLGQPAPDPPASQAERG